jgi:LacI family transcriptional regulator
MRLKIDRAIDELDYQPNLLARGLITGRSHTIGLLISDIRNPFFADLARGAEDAAGAAGYDLVLCNSDLDPAKHMKYFWALMAKRVDGVIMNSLSFLRKDDIRQMTETGVPIVLLNRPPARTAFSTVLSDNVRGGSLAAEYLIGLGHRRMAVLRGPRWQANLGDRAAGFIRTVRTVKGCAEPVVLHGIPNATGGLDMMRRLIGGLNGITAVFATNDAVAFGAIHAVLDAGLRIPDDLSLMGFDDVEMAAIVHPPLTTVRQSKYEIGAAAVEILIRQSGSKPAMPEHRKFSVELVERMSCRNVR